MPSKAPPQRATFRHGNLPEALIDAALERLEADGVEAISLRDLARDVGVNHRAVYRHFPDEQTLFDAKYYILAPADHVKDEVNEEEADARYRRIHENCAVLRFGVA